MPKQSRKIPGGARVGGLAIPLAVESQRKSRSLLFMISKFWGGLLIPFLSHPLCPLFPLTCFPSLSPLTSVELWCPLLLTRAFWPAAAITHFPGHWSLIAGFPCPYVTCASSFFSRYVSLLCYLSDCLYFLTIFLYHCVLFPTFFVSASFFPPTFSISLSDHVLSTWVFTPHLIVLNSWAPVSWSVSLAPFLLHTFTHSLLEHFLLQGNTPNVPLTVWRKSDQEVVSFTEQLVWVSLCIRKFLQERNLFH